ncbi:MAG: hypothetical protein WEB37_13100 [Bacteroidota bacterium]
MSTIQESVYKESAPVTNEDAARYKGTCASERASLQSIGWHRPSTCGAFTLKRITYVCLFFVAAIPLATAQESEAQSDALVLYGQMRSIAEELAAEFSVRPGQIFGMSVESQHQKTVTENQLLEVFKERGALIHLFPGSGSASDSVLRVVVLVQEAKRHEREEGTIVRSAETVIDARIETRSGEIPAQKMFRRTTTDTLQTRNRTAEMSMLERLLEPAIVIGGAILVVYLLFTVRSS